MFFPLFVRTITSTHQWPNDELFFKWPRSHTRVEWIVTRIQDMCCQWRTTMIHEKQTEMEDRRWRMAAWGRLEGNDHCNAIK